MELGVNVRQDYPGLHNDFDKRSKVRCILKRGDKVKLTAAPILVPGDRFWSPSSTETWSRKRPKRTWSMCVERRARRPWVRPDRWLRLTPRDRKLRRVGVGVLIGLAVVSVPLGVHIIETRASPELWLSLLGAVFMMVLICLYALETALAPIPERKIRTPIIPSAHETVMQEQTVIDEPPEVEQKTEMIEPEVFIHDVSGEDQEVVSLVEVEEPDASTVLDHSPA